MPMSHKAHILKRVAEEYRALKESSRPFSSHPEWMMTEVVKHLGLAVEKSGDFGEASLVHCAKAIALIIRWSESS